MLHVQVDPASGKVVEPVEVTMWQLSFAVYKVGSQPVLAQCWL